jgi:cold shock CspA family protein
MTYEFNAGDSAGEIKNPYKLENIFLIFSATALITGGIVVLLGSRQFLLAQQDKISAMSLVMASVLFGAGIKMAVSALSQLRVYFGRSFPKSLASELQSNQTGVGLGSQFLINMLRHRAIEFQPPKGPLSGILYSMVRPLISSPPAIQTAAVQHFHGIIGMVALVVSIGVSYILFHGNPYEGIVSWLYLPLTGLSLITPFFRSNKLSEPNVESSAMFWELIGLVLFSILAPVVLPKYVPAYPIAPMWIAPVVLLLTSMIASVLFLCSIFDQLDNVKQTDVSCEQMTLGMNCQPSQLWTEINREFQNNWTKNIPNRPYANLPPDVGGEARGSFQGYILEETQPQMSVSMAFDSLVDYFKTKHVKMLVLLTFWGYTLSITASLYGSQVIERFNNYTTFEISRSILIVISLTVSSLLSFKIAHLLWSRMYFKSRLIWIETQGTYQQSELSIGNQFSGHANSKSTLTRVEDATLRIWATDIVTVAFGQDNDRTVMALSPVDGFAKGMMNRLVTFAENQSSVLTPTYQGDLEKAMTIGRLSNAIKEVSTENEKELKLNNGSSKIDVLENVQQIGVIKFFNKEKQFGFIQISDGNDIYFSGKDISGHSQLVIGQKVSFHSLASAKGPQAKNIRQTS